MGLGLLRAPCVVQSSNEICTSLSISVVTVDKYVFLQSITLWNHFDFAPLLLEPRKTGGNLIIYISVTDDKFTFFADIHCVVFFTYFWLACLAEVAYMHV